MTSTIFGGKNGQQQFNNLTDAQFRGTDNNYYLLLLDFNHEVKMELRAKAFDLKLKVCTNLKLNFNRKTSIFCSRTKAFVCFPNKNH